MLLFLSFLLFLPKILNGFWLAHVCWRDSCAHALGLKFFLGIPLGLGLWSLAYFLWIWANLNRFIFPWIELLGSVLISIMVLTNISFSPGLWKKNLFQKPKVLDIVFWAVVFGSAVIFAIRLYMNPHGYEDAWFIWNLDSRFYYLADNFRILFSSGGPGWHPDYPLLVSLNAVSGWVVLGQDTTRVPIILAALYTVTLPGIVYFGLAILKDTKQAALAVIALLSAPMILHYGASQEADIPMSSSVLAALTVLAVYFKTRENTLLLIAGLITGLTAWAKNEGFLFILVVSAVLTIFLVRSNRWSDLKKYMLGVGLPLLVVMGYKLMLPVSNDLFSQNDASQFLDWSRYTLIFGNLVDRIAGLGRWSVLSLVGVLLLYAVLVGFDPPQSVIVKFVGLAVCLQLAGYIFIYILTPHDLVWHLKTSMERLLLQLFPASLFLFFYSTKSPDFNLLKGIKNVTRD